MRPRQTQQTLAFIRGLKVKIEAESEREPDASTAVFLAELSDDLDRFVGEIRGDKMRSMIHSLIVLIDWTVEAWEGQSTTDLRVALLQASITLDVLC